MSVARRKPSAVTGDTNAPPAKNLVTDLEVYAPAAVDTSIVAPSSLIAHMDGMPWTLDEYFNQVVTNFDEIKEIDLGQNAVHQQYRHVTALEIRVTSELSSSYDDKLGLTTTSGSAIILKIIPNKYDYFIARSATHERTLFMINGCVPKTYMAESVYEVQFTVIGHLSDPRIQTMVDALTHRTIEKFMFHKERLAETGQALLTRAQHTSLLEIKQRTDAAIKDFVDRFMDQDNKALMVPDITAKVYDHRLVDFFFSIVEQYELPRHGIEINRIRIENPRLMARPSLFNAILACDEVALAKTVIHKVGWTSNIDRSSSPWDFDGQFVLTNKPAFVAGPETWFIERYVCPVMSQENTAYYSTQDIMPGVDSLNARLPLDNVAGQAWNQMELQTGIVPLFKPVHEGEWYVLSESFYNRSEVGLSVLEVALFASLRGQSQNRAIVLQLLKHLPLLPRLEAFYYTPLVVFIGKQAAKGIF